MKQTETHSRRSGKIIVSPIGGLANRMRALASGVALADAVGRSFEAVWAVNSDLHCSFADLFEPSALTPVMTEISPRRDLWLYDNPRKRNLYLARLIQAGRYALKLTDEREFARYATAPSLLEERIAAARGDVLIRSGVIFYPFGDALYRSLFVPGREIAAAARDRVGGDGSGFIGVHIRRTDNLIAICRSPLRLFTDMIDREAERNPDIKFYLATDDDDVRRSLIDRYGDRIVTHTATVTRHTADGIRDALTDMTALSLCDRIYGSYWSSFSEAAAMMGGKPFEQLVIPE